MVLSVRLSQSWALCVWVLVVVVSTVEGEGSVDCSRWANTMVYKEECHKDIVSEEEVLPLLVTGSGGCGTHTTTILLQKTGLDVKHEDFGQDGAVSWMYAVDARVQCVQTECNGYPWGPPVMTKRFRRVLHQVRCPVSNIAALLTHSPRSMIFMSPLVKTASQRLEYLGEVERSARAYLAWNRHVESFADFRFQIETFNATDLCLRAGFNPARCVPFQLRKAVTKNRRRHKNLTLDDIRRLDSHLAQAIRDMAERYGYGDCAEDCKC